MKKSITALLFSLACAALFSPVTHASYDSWKEIYTKKPDQYSGIRFTILQVYEERAVFVKLYDQTLRECDLDNCSTPPTPGDHSENVADSQCMDDEGRPLTLEWMKNKRELRMRGPYGYTTVIEKHLLSLPYVEVLELLH